VGETVAVRSDFTREIYAEINGSRSSNDHRDFELGQLLVRQSNMCSVLTAFVTIIVLVMLGASFTMLFCGVVRIVLLTRRAAGTRARSQNQGTAKQQ